MFDLSIKHKKEVERFKEKNLELKEKLKIMQSIIVPKD